MKKNKVILTSLMAIALCVALIAGSTFALFTARDEVNVAINSGNVEISAAVTIEQTSHVVPDNEDGTIVDENGKTYNRDDLNNGFWSGTATLDGNNALLENMVPGDRADLKVAVTNQSDVDVIYRITVYGEEVENENSSILEIMETTLDGTTYEGLESYVGAWQVATANTNFDIAVSFELPITAGDQYQNNAASYTIAVEAVQGNANVDEMTTVTYYNSTKTEYIPAITNTEAAVSGATLGADVIAASQAAADNAAYANEYVGAVSAKIPAGAVDTDGSLKLIVERINAAGSDDADVQAIVAANEDTANEVIAIDVRVEGVKTVITEDNAIEISMFIGYYQELVEFYHKGELVNNATYDNTTGIVTFKATSFSPFTGVMKNITTAADFRAALEKGGMIVLGQDVVIEGNQFTVTKDTTIMGSGNSVIKYKADGNSSRLLWIDDDNVTLNLRYVIFDGDNKCERGVQVNTGYTANVNMEGCMITGITLYAINFCAQTTVDLNMEGCIVQGWAALNAYGTGNKIRISDSTLMGVNDKSYSEWNTFATICLEGDTTGHTTEHSSDYDIVIENSKIYAVSMGDDPEKLNDQYAIGFNSQSLNSTVVLNNVEVYLMGEDDRLFAFDNGEGNKFVTNEVTVSNINMQTDEDEEPIEG